jgi:hypothetical protein
MKKLLSLFLLISFTNTYCQDYKSIFLGKDCNSYKGLYLKYKEGTIGATIKNFYATIPTKNFQTPVYGRSEEYDFVTDTNTIKNREFLVVDVKPCSYCYDNMSEVEDYIFELNDGKETIYFLYDGKYDFNFPFLVKGFSFSKEYLSKNIEKQVDDFEDKTTFNSPISNDLSIMKVIQKGKTYYYLSLETSGSTINYNIKGVTILFRDGTKWSKPNEKIDVKVIDGSGWGYSSFIALNQQDLLLFSKKVIKKFRLYIYDNESPDDVEKFPYYVQSIMESK